VGGNPLAAVANMVDQITEQYPAFAPLLQIPEVAKLLIEASAPGHQWTTAKLQAAIQGTNWWKTTGQTGRQWQVTQLIDPATAANQQAAMSQQIHSAAGSLGIVLKPTDLGNIVEDALANGWTAGQIQQHLGNFAQEKTLKPGTIMATQTNLGSIAGDYGVPVSTGTSFNWAKRIAEGTATQDGFTAAMQQQAKALFPHLGDKIDAGFTVRQIADPYLQIAQQFGVLANPNTVDLSNPKWAKALQSRDSKGDIQGPMTLDDWQRHLMTDPQYGWDHTSNAREVASNLVQSLGKTFGVMG